MNCSDAVAASFVAHHHQGVLRLSLLENWWYLYLHGDGWTGGWLPNCRWPSVSVPFVNWLTTWARSLPCHQAITLLNNPSWLAIKNCTTLKYRRKTLQNIILWTPLYACFKSIPGMAYGRNPGRFSTWYPAPPGLFRCALGSSRCSSSTRQLRCAVWADSLPEALAIMTSGATWELKVTLTITIDFKTPTATTQLGAIWTGQEGFSGTTEFRCCSTSWPSAVLYVISMARTASGCAGCSRALEMWLPIAAGRTSTVPKQLDSWAQLKR